MKQHNDDVTTKPVPDTGFDYVQSDTSKSDAHAVAQQLAQFAPKEPSFVEAHSGAILFVVLVLAAVVVATRGSK